MFYFGMMCGALFVYMIAFVVQNFGPNSEPIDLASLIGKLKLEPGEHCYILPYNKNEISKAQMESIGGVLYNQNGIKTITLAVEDPTADLTFIKLDNPKQFD